MRTSPIRPTWRPGTDGTGPLRLARVGIVLALAAIGANAQAGTRAEVEKQYKRWAKAAMANDVDALTSILAPDYVLITFTGGSIAYDDYVATIKKRREEGKPAQKYTTKLLKLTEMDGEAEAVSEETYLSEVTDEKTGKKVRMRHIHRYRDTWRNTADGWRLRRTFTESETTTFERR